MGNSTDTVAPFVVCDDMPTPLLVRGSIVGRYEILGELGFGGMGQVFRARDVVLGREVALKTVKHGRALSHRDPRVVREAQAMARLDHPHVVPVYDVGRFTGGVYIAMECIRGVTLHAWLGERSRSPGEILAMFRQAGRGLAAAHAVGLVHRDFKPSNVMVGDDGRARVLDFGLARLHESDSGTAPRVAFVGESRPITQTITEQGAVLGTPSYMAPEQHRGERADARADQYAFCLALFEALHGHHPFPDADDVCRLAVAKHSGKFAAVPTRGVARRIDAALRRGLAPDPAARWPDMDALLAEIGRTPRWTRGVTSATACLGVVGIAWVLVPGRARDCADEGADCAVIEAAPVAAAVEMPDLAEVDAAMERGDLELVAERLASLRATTADEPGAQAELALREGRLAKLRGDVAVSAASFRVAWDRGFAAGRDTTAARALVELIDVLALTEQPAEALAWASVAQSMVTRLDDRELESRVHRVIGTIYWWNNDNAKALDSLERAIAMRSAIVPDGDVETAIAHTQLAAVYRLRLDAAKAREHLDRALAIARSDRGSVAQHVAALAELGTLEREAGHYGPAREHFAAAIALLDDDGALGLPSAGGVYHQLGMLEYAEGHYEAALAHHERALALVERAFGPDNTRSARVLGSLAVDCSALGREDEAVRHAEKALVIIEAVSGPDHDLASMPHNVIANVHLDHGNYEQGIVHARRVVELSVRHLGDAHVDTGGAYINLCAYELALGTPIAARQSCERAIEILQRAVGREHFAMSVAKGGLGRTLLALGENERARAELEDSLRIAQATQAGPAELVLARLDLARALWTDPRQRGRARAVARVALRDAATIDGAYGEAARREVEQWLAEHRSR